MISVPIRPAVYELVICLQWVVSTLTKNPSVSVVIDKMNSFKHFIRSSDQMYGKVYISQTAELYTGGLTF